jgi:hypothetical protein
MVFAEPTFAGVPLSLYRQLPAGVTVTFLGAGGQAPNFSLTNPADLLPRPVVPPPPPALLENISLRGGPGTDTFTPSNTLQTNTGQPGLVPTVLNTLLGGGDDDDGVKFNVEDNSGPGKGRGKGKGKGGGDDKFEAKGLPPGLAKNAEKGKQLPPGNPWNKVLQAQSNPQPIPASTSIPGFQSPLGNTSLAVQNTGLPTPPVQPLQMSTPLSPLQPSPFAFPGPVAPLASQPGPIIQLGPPFESVRL